MDGKPASHVYKENRLFDLTVRIPEEKRSSVKAIGDIMIDSPSCARVPIKELADVSVVDGPVQISRENGQRRMGIGFNIKGHDMGNVVREAQEQIAKRVKLPSGYYLSWGGQFENQQQAMKRLV